MPANFTDMQKNNIQKKLIDEGLLMLLKKGMKGIQIADLTKKVGIGTGTFYRFYKNKEQFVVDIIYAIKQEKQLKLVALAKKWPNGIPMVEMKDFFLQMLLHNNIYRSISPADYERLMREEQKMDHDDMYNISKDIIVSALAVSPSEQQFALFVQAYRIIVMGSIDLNQLSSDLLESTLDALVERACLFLYS